MTPNKRKKVGRIVLNELQLFLFCAVVSEKRSEKMNEYYQGINIREVIQKLSKNHNIKITEQGNEIDFYYCPFCKTHQIDFNIEKAVWCCHRCNNKGTLLSLYDSLEGENSFFEHFKKGKGSYTKKIDLEKLNDSLNKNLMKSEKIKSILESERMIEEDTMYYQKLGYADEKFFIPGYTEKHYHLKNCITFPVYDENKEIVNIRFKQMNGVTPEKYNHRNIFNLTGYGHLTTNHIYIPELQSPSIAKTKRIWIFEGEPDAIVAWQTLQHHAEEDFFYSTKIISGTGGAGSIPAEWTEEFFNVPTTIFYDCDKAGIEGAKKINSISPNIKIADIRYLLHDEEDNDINDLIKNIGMYRGYKALRFLEILAINENRNAEFVKELNDFKKSTNEMISSAVCTILGNS